MTLSRRIDQALGREDAYAIALAALEDASTPDDIEEVRRLLRTRLAIVREAIEDVTGAPRTDALGRPY